MIRDAETNSLCIGRENCTMARTEVQVELVPMDFGDNYINESVTHREKARGLRFTDMESY